MKHWIAGLALLTAALTPASALETEGFGVGFILGSPTGLSGSLPVGETNAFNGVIGYDLVGGGANITVMADYVWHRRDLIHAPEGQFSLYFGPGAYLQVSDDPTVGVRGVLGISYRPPVNPLEFLLEVGPGVSVLPDTEPLITAGLGMRYYF
jgi:hypothetical protein